MWRTYTLFFVCLAFLLWASEWLAKGLDRLGSKLHFSEELLGVLTALGADSPEIASSIVALLQKKNELGVGIVLGSNLFNLAALLGLGAIMAGYVQAGVAATIFNGVVAILITSVGAGLILGFVSPIVALIAILSILCSYIYLLAADASKLDHLSLPATWKRFLLAAHSSANEQSRQLDKHTAKQDSPNQSPSNNVGKRSWKPVLLILPALAVIVVSSIGVVNCATTIGKGWLPEAALGTFILAALTGLPNAFTAARLAKRGKGAAVITETFNSNTINVVVGITIPAVFLERSDPNRLVIFDLSWLVVMTGVATALSASSGKLTRRQGVSLLALYAIFGVTWTALFLTM